jgi:hypothetical protein
MTPATFADLITDDALACTRKHPEFRAAVENAAAHGVAHFRSLAAPYQWITKDVGRAAICVNALILHLVGGLTVHALTAACVENGTKWKFSGSVLPLENSLACSSSPWAGPGYTSTVCAPASAISDDLPINSPTCFVQIGH